MTVRKNRAFVYPVARYGAWRSEYVSEQPPAPAMANGARHDAHADP